MRTIDQDPPLTRREMILRTAATMFGERGFHAVRLDDLGAACGVTGPAIYRHFPSKEAILVAIFDRFMEELSGGQQEILERGDDDMTTLDELIRFHVSFAISNMRWMSIWDQHEAHLADADRARLRRKQRTVLTAVTGLLRQILPGLGKAEAAARVNAVTGMVHSVTAFRGHLPLAEEADLIARMALAALLVP